MSRSLRVFCLLIVLHLVGAVTQIQSGSLRSSIFQPNSTEILRLKPLAFTENLGQWDRQVLFRAEAGTATLWFTRGNIYFQFFRNDEKAFAQPGNIINGHPSLPGIPSPFAAEGQSTMENPSSANIEQLVFRTEFVGANPESEIIGEHPLTFANNYFFGQNQAQWHTNVPNYQAIVYKELYPGIDLRYRGDGKHIEYDFVISPGTDYSCIQMHYDGAKDLRINEAGNLVIETAWGEILELAPIIYQTERGKQSTLSGTYYFIGDRILGFRLSEGYNRNLPLVIDPVLVFGTYLGGGNEDWGTAVAVDSSGRILVAGTTLSSDFPVVNPYNSSLAGNKLSYDIFVTAFSPFEGSLLYSSYLGGVDDEYGLALAVDQAGCAYFTGQTFSRDFPIQNSLEGKYHGKGDAFVVKLAFPGDELIYSTFLGGTGADIGFGIAVDNSGSAHMTGGTNSMDFPLQPRVDNIRNGDYDAFAAKLTPSGSALMYSTYVGGNGADIGCGIALDNFGSAYITGGTNSPDFPTRNAIRGDIAGGYDVFVLKLPSSGESLTYSSFLGGRDMDIGFGIVVDDSGCAYLTGYTSSTNFPLCNPYDNIKGEDFDVFVSKISSAGNSLVFSTFLGGDGIDQAYGLAVDQWGCAYVTGYTGSSNFPIQNPYDSFPSGSHDIFVCKLDATGDTLVFGTYLGGEGWDEGRGIAIDRWGCVYVTGLTESLNFPTLHSYDSTGNGSSDAFVVRLCGAEVPSPPIAGFGAVPVSGEAPLTVIFTDSSLGFVDFWIWDFGDGTGATDKNPTHQYDSAGLYTVALKVLNAGGVDSLIKQDYIIVIGAKLVINPTRLDFDSTFAAGSFAIANRGSAPLIWTASASDSWLAIEPNGGEIITDSIRATVRVDRLNLEAGNYSGFIALSSNGGADTVHVSMVVSSRPNRPPEFVTALQDRVVIEGDQLSLTIIATDAEGDEVKFECPDLPPHALLIQTVRDTAILNFTPDYTDVDRLYHVRIVARDYGRMQVDSFSISVINKQLILDLQGTLPSPFADYLISQPILICFNEAVDSVSLANGITISSAEGDNLFYTYVPGDLSFAINSSSGRFLPMDRIAITIDGEVLDLAGYPLSTTETMTLVTGPGVFPGDTDNDGLVDERDILPLGIYWGLTGYARGPESGPAWGMQSSHSWNSLAATFADADGNGVVNAEDICAISDYWGNRVGSIRAKSGDDSIAIAVALKAADPGTLNALYDALSACSESEGKRALMAIMSGLLNKGDQTIPRTYELFQNRPNPFNPRTSIVFTLPMSTSARLSIYNVSGQWVTTLVDQIMTAGTHEVIWDGQTAEHRQVSSGIYFYRLETTAFTQTRKMILLK